MTRYLRYLSIRSRIGERTHGFIPDSGEFVESAWPTTMQRALRGDVSSQEMMESLQAHFDAALTATTSL